MVKGKFVTSSKVKNFQNLSCHILAGAPVAFKKWWGHMVGIIHWGYLPVLSPLPPPLKKKKKMISDKYTSYLILYCL